MIALVALVAGTATAGPAKRAPVDAARVGPGVYRPVFPVAPAEREIEVPAFRLDREPVTNADFLAFVRARPEWRRDRAKELFVDRDYLAHWGAPDVLGSAPPHAPVVRVSWFAARAYCAWRGGRLPREAEWELAAAADTTRRDASDDPAFQTQILAWYERPTPATLPNVGGAPNAWGVRDMHGLVWEWIEDFTGEIVGPACGAEAVAAKDPRMYAAFMRIAFRGALEARFTTANLGLRCAYDEVTP